MQYVLQLNDTHETLWVEYIIPASNSTGNHMSSHIQEYLLQDLVPGSEYVAVISARNVFGISEITEEFLFQTAAGLSDFYFQRIYVCVMLTWFHLM